MALFTLLVQLVLAFAFFGCSYCKRFLVIGGSDIIGSELVSQLVRQGDAHVFVLEFYSWHWDEAKHRKHASVTHIQCDRFMVNTCRDFIVLLEEGSFDVVYDTSTLKPNYLKDILVLIRQKVGRYVFISTAAVYQIPPSHGGNIEEDADQYDTDLESYNHYGDLKLQCEDVLKQEHDDHQLTYIILRLPDVIGPRDNSDRFWIYFLWVKFQDVLDRPLYFPPRLHNQQLSMVHTEDVAMLMLSLIDARNDVFNQPYNLAFKETATLKEFLAILGKHVGNTKLVLDESRIDGAVYFPSVTRGPVNVTKAEKMLQWNPVSLKEGVRKTVQFYSSSIQGEQYKAQLENIIDNYFPPSKADTLRQLCHELYVSFDLNKSRHTEL